MTATASIVTTEMVAQKGIGVIRLDSSTKEYENRFVAKEALDELLILWLTTLAGKEYVLSGTHAYFKLEIPDDAHEDRTRYVTVRTVIHA